MKNSDAICKILTGKVEKRTISCRNFEYSIPAGGNTKHRKFQRNFEEFWCHLQNLDRESWKTQHFWSEFCRWHSGRCKFKKPIKGHWREPKEKKRQETRYLSIEKGTFLLKKGHFTKTLIWSLAHGFTKGRKDHSFCRNVKALPVLPEIEGSSLHKAAFWQDFVLWQSTKIIFAFLPHELWWHFFLFQGFN